VASRVPRCHEAATHDGPETHWHHKDLKGGIRCPQKERKRQRRRNEQQLVGQNAK
jgi:hypothetical protein